MSSVRRGDFRLPGHSGELTPNVRAATTGDFLRGHVEDASKARLSRRLLIEAIKHLDPFKDSLTVIGAHAVFARVAASLPDLMMPSTNDADLAVNPKFIAPEPVILDLMKSAGLVPVAPERPGVYGYEQDATGTHVERTTIDLIVPEAYAGKGRRAARIEGQKSAASRASGIEFAMYDRDDMEIASLDGDPQQDSVRVMVAGPAALIAAKSFKLRDRLAGYGRRPDRLRPKDSGDIGLLMISSDAGEVAETLQRISAEDEQLHGMGSEVARFVVDQYARDMSKILYSDLVETVTLSAGEDYVTSVDGWIQSFEEHTRSWRGP